MPDPVASGITDLAQVERTLEIVAVPQVPFDTAPTAAAQPVLTTTTGLLKVLYPIPALADVRAAGVKTADVLKDAAAALRAVAKQLNDITSSGADVQQTLQSLQNALAVAQTLLPTGQPQLAAGSQFFGQMSGVLTAVGNDTRKAAELLFKFAQQLAAVEAAIRP